MGKTIGLTSGDSLSQIFPAVLAANGLSLHDVRIISFPTPWAKEEALLRGKVDAFLGYYLAQPVRLKISRNIDLEWLTFAEAGVNTLSNSIIVNTRFLRELDNPQQAAQILSKYSAGAGLNLAACKMQIETALKLLHTDKTVNKPIGWTSSEDWEKTMELLRNYTGLRVSGNPSRYYTNDYLSDIR
jgi:NitT/TauT family transport system substrate-binding protein